ncbi:peroxidase TAP [Usnea florida]
MTSTLPPLDLNNVQGDILAGLPKKTQTYFFFLIDDSRVHEFRTQLSHLIPLITTTAEVLGHQKTISQCKGVAAQHGVPAPLLKISGVNLVFSHKGLSKMGIDDSTINDPAFTKGMLADALDLGDPPTTADPKNPDWVPAFKHGVDGMVLVSGECHATVAEKLAEIEKIFFVGTPSATIHEALRIVGDVRPGNEKGHEHFGFKDGISQPAIQGVDPTNNPGQEFVPPGVTILGREGDGITRPGWAVDGSFLAFRYLFQLVPEFNTFLKKNPIVGPAPDLGSELLGARLVGRWKSGAPVDLAPTHDDPAIANDNSRNNNFSYDFPEDQQTQDRCPFAAHTRKTNPRADLEKLGFPTNPTTNHRIIRRGIQFGPEVSAAEAASEKTTQGRGLLFAAYQSNLGNGFQFIQKSWANSPTFISGKPGVPKPGFDPIIGADGAGARSMVGTNPASQSTSLPLPTWVVPKGGEYFFSPSISALKTTFALA